MMNDHQTMRDMLSDAFWFAMGEPETAGVIEVKKKIPVEIDPTLPEGTIRIGDVTIVNIKLPEGEDSYAK